MLDWQKSFRYSFLVSYWNLFYYKIEIWEFGNNDILERAQLKFGQLLLHLKTTTPGCMVYGELGRYPVENDIK
jgi:hypothetical protein